MAHSKTTWQPGQSGNRSGKPKGSSDKRTALRELLLPHAPALVEKALELALSGDTTALKLCLDRMMPPLRAKEEPVTFALERSAPLADLGRSVIQAIATGHLTPDQGGHILSALAGLAKLVELDELEQRIAALEGNQ